MSMNESVAYLKGLAEGLEIDSSKKEGKLLLAIIDVLDEMAGSVNDLEETCDELDEMVDILDQDLGSLEEDFYDLDDEDDDDEEDEEDLDDLYEVTCPSCGDVIYLTEDMLLEGDMDCPNCGQKLEFDLDGCCDDEDCDCCGHEHGDEE
jgi:hypothetical protein